MTNLTITKEERKWIDHLVDIVEEAIESWVFYPEDEYGAPDAIIRTGNMVRIPTGIMVRMQEAFEKINSIYEEKLDNLLWPKEER